MGTFIGLADDSTDLQEQLQSYADHYSNLESDHLDTVHKLIEELNDVIDGAVTKAARGFDQTTAW